MLVSVDDDRDQQETDADLVPAGAGQHLRDVPPPVPASRVIDRERLGRRLSYLDEYRAIVEADDAEVFDDVPNPHDEVRDIA